MLFFAPTNKYLRYLNLQWFFYKYFESLILFQLSHVFEKIMGRRLFNRVMKMSFYGHFVAGEDDAEVKVTEK